MKKNIGIVKSVLIVHYLKILYNRNTKDEVRKKNVPSS